MQYTVFLFVKHFTLPLVADFADPFSCQKWHTQKNDKNKDLVCLCFISGVSMKVREGSAGKLLAYTTCDAVQ